MKLARVEIAKGRKAIDEALAAEDVTPLVLTRNGKAVAALMPMDEDDIESLSLSLDPRFQEMIERGRRRVREEGAIPEEELKELLGQ